MSIFDARTARVLATVLLYGLALAFIYLAWRSLVTFLFAILFAYLLEPVVAGLHSRLGLSRARAVAALYLVVAMGLALFLFFLGPRIVQQAAHLSDLAPSVAAGVTSGRIAQDVGNKRGWSYDTQHRLQQFLVDHRSAIARWEQTLLGEIANVAANIGWVALIPVLAIFFLLSGDRFNRALLELLERRRQRIFVAGLLHDVHNVLANYIRAQIVLAALALVVYLVGFEALRLPYAIALGVAAGVLEFIPVIGPLVGALLVLATTFVLDYPHLWLVLVFLGVWRLVQDYVNSPRIMGGQVQLDPLAVLFGVFAGAEVAGVIGVYLSIPVIATLRVVWIRWRDFEVAQAIGRPAAEAAPSGPIRPPS